MNATRSIASWPGLIACLCLAGIDGAAAGRAGEGAPVAPPALGQPVVLVESGRMVDVAGQVLWSDPERIHVLGLLPQLLLAVEPLSGIVEVRAREGAAPFDIQGPVALLSAGSGPEEIFVHQPGRLQSLRFGRSGGPAILDHEVAVTACAASAGRTWWMRALPYDPSAGVPGEVALHRDDRTDAVWTFAHEGDFVDVLAAQYFTRLLPAPGGRLWRVCLGMEGRADLVDPRMGTSERLRVDPAEGGWLEASVDRRGVLHLLTSGGAASLGKRILRFDPRPAGLYVGDRDWNTGAVDPSGSRWAAVDAETGELLIYELPATTGPNSP